MNIDQMIDSIKGMTPTATDDVAVKSKTLYPLWESLIGKEVKPGDRARYNDRLYKVGQNGGHTVQADWAPDKTPAMWTVIDPTHAGTLEDPIPAVASMEYTKGLYYIEADIIYLMNRQGMADGETIVLHYLPSQLVGQYFMVVK